MLERFLQRLIWKQWIGTKVYGWVLPTDWIDYTHVEEAQ